ncbi:MAG TPA: carbohydrate porin [Bacteroidia bacterium]|jgi:high affinity Mn2+ porin|nr:carbohydrate porin [Bacteroidia bacterium]
MNKFTSIKAAILFCLLLCCAFAQAENDSAKKGNGWMFHYQLTAIDQYHGYFHAPYSGHNSLQDTTEQDMSVTSTLYLGRKLWKYAAVYFTPEISGGKGFSGTTGIAGFPNGEIYRVGNPTPAAYIARCYFQQSFALAGSHDTLMDDDLLQVSQLLPTNRLTFSVGKFSLADFYDNNTYSHDPRTQFMNWVLMDNGAWDYPANTRGYTYAFVVQYISPTWHVNLSDALEPLVANGPDFDWNIGKTFGITAEIGSSYRVNDRVGNLSVLLYLNQNRAANYENAIANYEAGNVNALHIDSLSAYNGNKKYGVGLSWDHPIGKYIGVFLRAGWNDGKTGTWAFTEVDQTITPGVNFDGAFWHRKTDNFGIAYIINGLSKDHLAFEQAGGYQFIIGDGSLVHYAPEQILEAYYQAKFFEHFYLALDYQFVQNPAYNADRGPVNIGSVRVHVEF